MALLTVRTEESGDPSGESTLLRPPVVFVSLFSLLYSFLYKLLRFGCLLTIEVPAPDSAHRQDAQSAFALSTVDFYKAAKFDAFTKFMTRLVASQLAYDASVSPRWHVRSKTRPEDAVAKSIRPVDQSSTCCLSCFIRI